MAKTSKYWDDRALRRLDDAEKMGDEYITRIKKIYDKAYKDVDREIANVYKNYSKDTGLDVEKLKELLTRSETKKTWEQLKRQGLDKYIKDNYKARISRLEQIQAQIYAKAKLIYPKEELEQTMCYKGVINDSYYKAVYDTQMGTGYGFNFSKIDKNIMDAVLSERWSGKNYSQRIWGNTDILANTLSEVLGGALMSGQSIEKTSKQVRDRFNVSKYYAERLVRTETNHFNNLADAMAYEEMGVKKYVFVATLDNRTSEICISMDNKVFKYSEKEEGVNYPPLHPNCRSKTRGYIGEEEEKRLQRRARNPKTGKNELVDNMSYTEWAEKNGLLKDKPVKTTKKPVKNKDSKPVMSVNNLPPTFTSDKKELKNAQIWTDFINSQKDADPKVVKVFNSMGKMQTENFKISHAKSHALSYRGSGYKPYDIKLTIPNIKNADDLANINITLHENTHWIDFMSGDNLNNRYISLGGKLADTVHSTSADMSDDISKLFTDFNNGCNDIKTTVASKYKPLYSQLTDEYKAGGMGYDTYKRKWSKLTKDRNEEIIGQQRVYMGGGLDNLQDIYDALSRGVYRDAGRVKYGHGTKYYKDKDSRVKEIVANYTTLSISRPDVIKMLKADKPALVNELDNLMDMIISKYGG